MSFDTLIMKAIKDELQEELTGAPVQRVYENERGEIILYLHSRGHQPGLLFSTDPRYARIHLTHSRYSHRDKPSPFCMLLRKYLISGRVKDFFTPPLERILEMRFAPPYGMPPVRLIAEIMGRRSNLILVDDKDNVLGAAKTVSWEKNPRRAILPGEIYRPVPPQNKLNPLEMNCQRFSAFFRYFLNEGKEPEQALFSSVGGLSPLTARELLYRSGWKQTSHADTADEHLFEEVKKIFAESEAGRFTPVMLPDQKIYAAIELTHLAGEKQVTYEQACTMLDQFYGMLISEDREKTLREQLKNTVNKRLKNLTNKKKQQEKELEASTKAPRHRLFGEMLLAYGHEVPKGADSVVLPDLYNPEEMVEIPLDPAKSVSANAQRHFNRYQKAKKGRKKIRAQINKTKTEIEYCQNLLYALDSGDLSSLEEIRQEMIEAGYLPKKEQGKEKKKGDTAPQPFKFKSSAGHTILVGRNNRQNDHITFKTAARRDTWFHAREIPGSHVLLKEAPSPPPDEDIEEAAFLAAYFSRGRESGAVDIDYTEVRHVRRRPGSKPGSVFYENFNTVTANPGDQKLRERFGLE